MKYSAGILFYKKLNNEVLVLIVHPSGNYNRNAPYSIPKGEINKGELPIDTAIRECEEEVNIKVGYESVHYLNEIIYSSKKKKVICFKCEIEKEVIGSIKSWEIDDLKWVNLDLAKEMLMKDQKIFIDDLKEFLKI